VPGPLKVTIHCVAVEPPPTAVWMAVTARTFGAAPPKTVTPAALFVIEKAFASSDTASLNVTRICSTTEFCPARFDGQAEAVEVGRCSTVDEHRRHGRCRRGIDDLGHRRRRIVTREVIRVAGVDGEQAMRTDAQVGDGEGDSAAAEGWRGDDGVALLASSMKTVWAPIAGPPLTLTVEADRVAEGGRVRAVVRQGGPRSEPE